jgi:hypothetical protein
MLSFSRFANVIIFVLSFFLVQGGCFHLCYHLMLSFPPFFLFPENVTHSPETIISKSQTMMPKAIGLAQHGGPPGWLESDPAGCDSVYDGRSMPPALKDHTTCSGLGLIYVLQNVHKTPPGVKSRKEDMAWYSSRPMPSLWSHTILFVTSYTF